MAEDRLNLLYFASFLSRISLKYSITSFECNTDPYFIQISSKEALCDMDILSNTQSSTTTTLKPKLDASKAVARTHPLVTPPIMIMVSTFNPTR